MKAAARRRLDRVVKGLGIIALLLLQACQHYQAAALHPLDTPGQQLAIMAFAGAGL